MIDNTEVDILPAEGARREQYRLRPEKIPEIEGNKGTFESERVRPSFKLIDDAGKTQVVQERLGREIRAQATSDEVRVKCFTYLCYAVYEAKRRSKAHRGGVKLQVEGGSKTKAWDDITPPRRHGGPRSSDGHVA